MHRFLCIYTPDKVLPGVNFSVVAWEREQVSDIHFSNPSFVVAVVFLIFFSFITPTCLLSPLPPPDLPSQNGSLGLRKGCLDERECGRQCLLLSF